MGDGEGGGVKIGNDVPLEQAHMSNQNPTRASKPEPLGLSEGALAVLR